VRFVYSKPWIGGGEGNGMEEEEGMRRGGEEGGDGRKWTNGEEREFGRRPEELKLDIHGIKGKGNKWARMWQGN
jgi:hypothetical protein